MIKHLTNEGFEPLDVSKTSNEWQEILQGYQRSTKEIFEDLDKSTITEKILRERCQRAFKQDKDSEDYRLARKWCVKKQSIKQLLSKKGFKVLDTNNTNDDTDWTKLASLSDEEGSSSRVSVALSKDKVGALKEICKGFENLNTIEDDFNEKLEIAQDTCSIKTNVN